MMTMTKRDSALNHVDEWARFGHRSIVCKPDDRHEMLAVFFLRQGSLDVEMTAAAPSLSVENGMLWMRHAA